MANQIITVTGFVQKVIGKIYAVLDVNTNNVYKITYDGFLPLLETDVIYGEVLIDNRKGAKFIKKPIVKFSTEKESIVGCIKKSQKFSISPQMASKVYDKLLIDLQGIMSVDDYLNKLSIELNQDNSLDNEGLLDYLTKYQFKRMLQWWYKNRVLRKLYLFGINNTEIRKISHFCDMNPLEIYEQCLKDPFVLVPLPLQKCYDIYEINFKKYTPEQIYRASIIRDIYDNMEKRSWTATPTGFVINKYQDIVEHLVEMQQDYKISGDFYSLYLDLAHRAESTVAKAIAEMIIENDKLNYSEFEEPEYQRSDLTDNQKLAIKLALNLKVICITGPAGSGKTTIIKELVHNLESKNVPYMIGSFTGKAVARIKEITKRNSPMTLHMMITQHKTIPPFKMLIIDETSMITTELLYMFLKKFGWNYQLVLIGDPNQLEPISWGNLFPEILNSGKMTRVHLDSSHRSDLIADKNYININADNLIKYVKMKRESPDEFIPPFEFEIGDNFVAIPGNLDIVYHIVEALSNNSIKSTELTILSPYVKNLPEINAKCQSIFNVSRRYVVDPKGIRWIVGDKVSITTNNYNLNLMNGDEGLITDVTDEIGESGFHELMIEFKSGNSFKFAVTYDKDISVNDDGVYDETFISSSYPTLSSLTHSYAQTVHKSQGSEYEYVIFYLDPEHIGNGTFINRHLVYTAITRPRKLIWIVGDIQQLELHATMNPSVRYDNLSQRIKDLVE